MIIQKYSYIRKYLFIFSILFLLSGCDIVDAIADIFNGEDDISDDELLTSATIGTNGGKINADGLTLTIPAGSFSESVEINIYSSSVTDVSIEDISSKVYKIEGLPDQYSKPIDVSIKHNGNISEESYLVLQEDSYIPSLDSIAASNIYFDATVVGDSIKSQIPAISSDIAKVSSANFNKSTNSPTGLFSITIFGSSNNKNYTTINNHFKIIYNSTKNNISDITNLGQYLEDAYTKIQGIGFDFSRRTNWPVSVSIAELGNAHGLFTPSHWSTNSSYLRFDRTGLGEQELVKTTAIHEFFHLVQYLYDYRGAFSQGSFAPDHYWFNEACSVWSEGLVASAGYVSANWLANQLRPFNGIQAGSLDNPEKHGYGMASFVKYLVGNYGKSVLVGIYEKLLAKRHVIDAINNSTNYNLFLDCNSFFKRYSQGLIFPDFGPGNLAQITENEFDIKSAADTLKTFTANYKDLSAKVYLIKLENPNFKDDASLEISIDQNLCDITVFKYPSPGTSSVIAEGQKSCIVSDLKGLKEQNKRLLVMVTNSNYISNNYQPSNLDINLKMEVKTVGINMVEIEFNIDHAHKYTNYNNTTDDYDVEFSDYFNSGAGTSSFNNNTYSTVFNNPPILGKTIRGNMKTTFNSYNNTVYVHVDQYRYWNSFFYGDVVQHFVFSATVPFNKSYIDDFYEDSTDEYYISGESTCGSLTVDFHEDNDKGSEWLGGIQCGGGAYIKVKVHLR